MRHIIRTGIALAVTAAAATAQEPTVSPALTGLAGRDTVVAVWFFARPDLTLDSAAAVIRAVGGDERRHSRWLHAVSADLPAGRIADASRRSEFLRLQPVARFRGEPETPEPVSRPFAAAPGMSLEDSVYGPSAMPLRQLEMFPLAQRNLGGAGVVIAVLDTGFETALPAFASAFVLAQYDFIFDDDVVANEANDDPAQSRHGTAIWSLLAANDPGSIVGVAPDAAYILAKTEDVRSETPAEEDNWVAAIEWADSLGATIVSSSLGYIDFDGGSGYAPSDLNGDIAVTTVAADAAAARGITVVTAAGNRGPAARSLLTPADGDSVIAAGAEDSLGVLAPFSSRGPTADGRRKPDLLAPGVQVFVIDPLSGSGYARVDGTSAATPLLAGAAALIKQLHPTFLPMEILQALRRYGTRAAAPDSAGGWGRPNVARSALFPLGVVTTGPEDLLLTSVTPTLSWDAPALPAVAQPVSFRLEVSRDTLFGSVIVDTVLSSQSYQLSMAGAPGSRFTYRVTAITTDSVATRSARSPWYRFPPWVSGLTPDDAGGVVVRELRPTLRWTAPDAASPPGPFTFDLQIVREDDGEVEIEATGLTETRYTPSRDLERNTPYRWAVIARLGSDSARAESEGSFIIVDDSEPTTTLLFQNFPNPFPNREVGLSSTCLWFDLAVGGRVRLDILDARGHIVRNIVPGTQFEPILPAGRYGRADAGGTGSCDPRLLWDGRNSTGAWVPQGIYIARLATPEGSFTKRIVFMGEGF